MTGTLFLFLSFVITAQSAIPQLPLLMPNNPTECRLETKSFVIIAQGIQCSTTAVVAAQPVKYLYSSAADTGDRHFIDPESTHLFQLHIYHKSVMHENRPRHQADWSTVLGRPFLYSAVGNDSLGPGNGEYRVMQNNQLQTTAQSITGIRQLMRDGRESIELTGQLFTTSLSSSSSSLLTDDDERLAPVIDYVMLMEEVDGTAMEIDVQLTPLGEKASDYDRIILSYFMAADEEVFGLGEQFSFWSLQGQRIPIITRFV
jgi:hypothetical protein